MIQSGLILVLPAEAWSWGSMKLQLFQPRTQEWLFLGPLSYPIPPAWAKVPTAKGPRVWWRDVPTAPVQ